MLKSVLGVLLCALFVIPATAQFEAGQLVLGGTATFSNREYFDISTFNEIDKQFTILPRIGSFVSGSTEIGASFGYTYSEGSFYDNWNGGNAKQDGAIILPYVRQYFTLNEWSAFYVQGAVGYIAGRSSVNEDLGDSQRRSRTWLGNISPGVSIILSQRVMVEFQAQFFNYTRSTVGLKDNYSDSKSDPLEVVEVGPNLSEATIGISFLL